MIRVYLAIALAAALGLCGWYAHHKVYRSGYDAGQKSVQDALAKAEDANQAFVSVVAAKDKSIASCELGRIADQKNAEAAAKEADAARAALAPKFDAADRALSKRLSSDECHEWANEPACGSVP